MLKYLLFNHIVCMGKKKKKKNSSLKQNCRPRCNLSHHLSMQFPLMKNLYQDHELVKSEFNASVVCWIKVKIWNFFICKPSYLHSRFLPHRTKVSMRFLTGLSHRAVTSCYKAGTFQMPRPIDRTKQGRAHAEAGFRPQTAREALRFPRVSGLFQKSIIS